MKGRTEEMLAETQCRFRANRNTTDQIYFEATGRKKNKDFEKDFYVSFIDFSKAFDSIWRKGLWETVKFYIHSTVLKITTMKLSSIK